MNQKGCFVISFDKGRVSILWEGREAFDLLDFLFKDGSQRPDDDTASLFTLKSINPQTLLLYQKETPIAKGNQGRIAVRLLDKVLFELAKESRGGLLFHAAALSRNGRSIVMPGRSGSGKTFLAAGLAGSGYSCLTDEITLVEPGRHSVGGFYKPLHIKNPDAFNHQAGLKVSPGNLTDPAAVLHVAKGFLTNRFYVDSGKRPRKTQASMILFPNYEHGAKLAVKRLACANTGLLLMQNLINARNLTSHGFHDVAMLSRQVPGYAVTYGDSSRVVEAVASLCPF
jgi:hypothetical protein